MSTFKEAFTEDSFYLKFQPILDPQGAWTGDIDISAIIHDDHSLSYEELGEMLHVLQMVCASVPLYEQDDEVREKAMAIVDVAMEDPNGEYLFKKEDQQKAKPSITTEGNVIQLRFDND